MPLGLRFGVRQIRTFAWVLCVVSGFLQIGFADAQEQSYPNKTIHLVVGFPPGGANDVLARQLAPRLSAALGDQSVIVENHPGVDGIIGTGFVAHAKPDGYTLGLTSMSAMSLSPFTYKDLQFNPVTDFGGVSTLVGSEKLFVVNPSVPIHSLTELIAYAKANPGKLNFAIVGNGGANRMMLELFKMTTHIDVQAIVYTGASQAMTDLMGGRVDGMTTEFSILYPLVKQGTLRALAITGNQRSPMLPDIPTTDELGFPDLAKGNNWYALLTPAGTPPEIVKKLNVALHKVNETSDMKKVYVDSGLEVMTQDSSEAFTEFLKGQLDRWGKVVTTAGIKAE